MPTNRPGPSRRVRPSTTRKAQPAFRRRRRSLWGALALVLGSSDAFANPTPSSVEAGRPLIHNYSRRDFGAEVQQWDVVQDARGIMYFANNAGVLEFDGRKWRLIELPSRLDVRALASDAAGTGRIYVGTGGDFGYLTPDAVGQLRFTSLLPAEARQDLRFDQVFTPVSAPDGRVYFQARTKVCRWSGAEVTCKDTTPALSRIFVAGRKLYVQQQGVGLMEMAGDTLRPVPGGERFAREEINVLLPYGDGDDDGIVVGLRTSELFVLRARTCEPFAPAVHDRRADERLTDGAVLPDGSFAFGTRLRGLLVIDRQGRLLHQIDRAAGLQDNYVHAVLPDRQGGLWLALQTGASRVEVASPFSVFDEASGLEQEWRAVLRHEGSLYVRGYAGLFEAPLPSVQTTPARAGTLRFRRVPEIESSVWSMLPIGDRLLVSSQNGIDEIRAKRPRRVISYPSTPMTMYRSRTDPRRIYVGLASGLASLYLADEGWQDEGRMPGIDETITSIAETKTGKLWLVSQRQRVLHVDLAVSDTPGPRSLRERRPSVRLYPPGEAMSGRISIQEIAGRPVFLSDQRIAEFDEASGAFVPAPELAVLSEAGRRSFSHVTEDRHGNLWVASRKPGGVDFLRKQPDGAWRLDNAGLRQVLAWSVYPEAHSDVVWLCTPDYLLRYDPSLRTQASRAFTTLIRRVTADERTVVYGGAPMADAAAAGRAETYRRPAFTYDTRSLQFEFAATAFDAAELNQYQSRLEGFDHEWSTWSPAPSRVYTNLSPGDYRFVVRARDIHGQVSASSAYSFAVLPPWYYSRWAYALYASLVAGLMLLIRRFEQQRSQAKLRRERQSMELDKLRELDSLKSRFFADISHELRTPLTLILAPVNQMIEEAAKPRIVQKLQLVRSHAEYLLRLIGQILDLSKLEARRMQLQASSGDLAQFVERGVASFAPAAEAGGIELTFRSTHDARSDSDADTRVASTWFDRDVLEKILNNVIGNALKFTPHGGTVSIAFTTGASEAGHGSWAEIVVADTGIGIPRDRLPHIFDRFYQVDGARSREGIGIGLALVKELVELHAGTIAVESAEGKGTTFVIRLSTEKPQTEKAQVEPDSAVPAPSLTHADPARAESPAVLDAVMPPALAAATASEPDEDTVVLIVEDNSDVRRFVREQLDPYYRVLEAANGAEGLELAVSSLPDLVLSDVSMPAMDGYDLCRTLKNDKRTCHIPVVLLTARTGRADKLHGLDTGADSWLVKPFDSWELIVQVRNLIEQRRRLRERFSAPIVLKPSELGVTPMDEAFLQKVLSVVQANLAEPDFDVVRLGREVGLSRSQLHRKLRALTNQSPTLLIRSIRLQRAAELLQQKSGSVAEIAYGVGFSSQAYFAKCFREELGCSPKEYARGVFAQPDAPAPVAHTR
jgi:signal transduction histidine kinase/DNA-binding response OmpR family regulator